jgi:hypothetical protein
VTCWGIRSLDLTLTSSTDTFISPASALPVEARQAAEVMLADAGRTYYNLT